MKPLRGDLVMSPDPEQVYVMYATVDLDAKSGTRVIAQNDNVDLSEPWTAHIILCVPADFVYRGDTLVLEFRLELTDKEDDDEPRA